MLTLEIANLYTILMCIIMERLLSCLTSGVPARGNKSQ